MSSKYFLKTWGKKMPMALHIIRKADDKYALKITNICSCRWTSHLWPPDPGSSHGGCGPWRWTGSSAAAAQTGRGSPPQPPAASSKLQSDSRTAPAGSPLPCWRQEENGWRSTPLCGLKTNPDSSSPLHLYTGFLGLLWTSRSWSIISGASSFCPIRNSSAIMYRTCNTTCREIHHSKRTQMALGSTEEINAGVKPRTSPQGVLVPGGKEKPVLWPGTRRGRTGLCCWWAEASQAWLRLTEWSSQTAGRHCPRPFCTHCESRACPRIWGGMWKRLFNSNFKWGDVNGAATPPTFSQHRPSAPHPRPLGGSSSSTCGTDSQSVRWSPLLPAPSPGSWCPGGGPCSASSHTEARSQRLCSWCQHQHFQGA